MNEINKNVVLSSTMVCEIKNFVSLKDFNESILINSILINKSKFKMISTTSTIKPKSIYKSDIKAFKFLI